MKDSMRLLLIFHIVVFFGIRHIFVTIIKNLSYLIGAFSLAIHLYI